MRTLFNKLVLGMVVGAIAAIGVVSVMGQDDVEKTAAYTKFTACYKAQDDAGMVACIAVGKEYMQKYGTPPDQYNEFVGKQVVNLEARLAALPLKNAYAKLDAGLRAKNWKDFYDGGRDVIRLESKPAVKLDITLLLATVGYDLAFGTPPDLTYKAEALNYAKSAIQMMESGTASEARQCPGATTGAPPVTEVTWGLCGNYAYKSKDNALAWMNYSIARLTADTNKDATKSLALLKEAAPYFYKSVQYNSDIKKFHTAYQALGRYYLEELNHTVDQYEPCKALTEDTEECKRLRGVQLAYAQLGLDAFARAYAIAKSDPKQTPAFRESLNKIMTNFYNVRFKKTDGIDAYVQSVTSKPLADPSAAVVPIIEAAPTAVSEPAPSTTKPTTTGGAKPAGPPATTAKPPATTPATAPSKPATTKGKVSKVVAKKKTKG